MYGKLEEEFGLAKRAMTIYERATEVVADEDKFEVRSYFDGSARINNFVSDVYHLHCKGYRQLWPAGN